MGGLGAISKKRKRLFNLYLSPLAKLVKKRRRKITRIRVVHQLTDNAQRLIRAFQLFMCEFHPQAARITIKKDRFLMRFLFSSSITAM